MNVVHIYVRREQQDWLKSHPVLNLSGLVAQIIKEERVKPAPFTSMVVKRKQSADVSKESRSVRFKLSIKPEDKLWLEHVRKTNCKNKYFLSAYVQKRLDYIIETGIVNLKLTF